MMPVLSLVDAERSIKTSSALKIIDAILDENKAAKLEMVEDVKTDAIETLCGALKRIAPATHAEAFEFILLNFKMWEARIQSLRSIGPVLTSIAKAGP